MKKILTICTIGLFFNSAAQDHDKTILITIEEYSGARYCVQMEYDHPFDTLTFKRVNTNLDMYDGNICMSDSIGNLIFYANGLKIYNKNHQLMKYGDSLNITGAFSDSNFIDRIAEFEKHYPQSTHSNAIPLPGQSNQYLFFHHPSYFINDMLFFKTMFTRIDMALDNENGAVIEKNVPLNISSKGMEVCKHANGIDWWAIGADSRSDSLYLFLINEAGIIHHNTTKLGTHPTPFDFIQKEFNHHHLRMAPTGDFFVSVHKYSLDLFSFDRCSGKIEFIKEITIPYNNAILYYYLMPEIGHAEFSEDGRFLYTKNLNIIYQFDLDNPDIPPFRLAIVDPTYPFLKRLPNGKIWIYSSQLHDPLYYPISALISKPHLPGSSSKINTSIFSNFITLSPYLINGHIRYSPAYKLSAMQLNEDETCLQITEADLKEGEIFIIEDREYHQLFRTKKQD